MSTHTDSQIVEYNEDGSWTTTTVTTEYPLTGRQKATAYAALTGILVAPFVPLISVIALEKWENRKERKRIAQQDKKND